MDSSSAIGLARSARKVTDVNAYERSTASMYRCSSEAGTSGYLAESARGGVVRPEARSSREATQAIDEESSPPLSIVATGSAQRSRTLTASSKAALTADAYSSTERSLSRRVGSSVK